MIIHVTSWNVNGLRKVITALSIGVIFPFLVHVFLAQETFAVNTKLKPPLIPGFVGFHLDAIKATWGRGRASSGLSSFFSEALFAHGKLKQEPLPLTWVLPVTWILTSGSGLVFINLYVPLYTRGFDSTDINLFERFVRSLRQELPNDNFILGGDFNLDRFPRLSRPSIFFFFFTQKCRLHHKAPE